MVNKRTCYYMESQQQTMGLDEALTRHVGEFGRGALAIVILTSLYYIPNVAIFYLLVFTTIDPIAIQRVWECTNPADAMCSTVWQAPGPEFCTLQQSQWRWTSLDNLAARFNMICQDKWKVQLLNMCMFCGCLVGAALFGYVNDKYGRKKPLLVASCAVAVAVFVTTAAPSYVFLAIARFITGIAAAGQNQCIALLNTEIAGKTRRGRASIISGMFWAIGEFCLVGLAVAVPNWRMLTTVAASMASAVLLWSLLIPESARWLLSQGRVEEATAVVRRIAAWNGSSLPPGVQLVASKPATDHPEDDQQECQHVGETGLEKSAAGDGRQNALYAEGLDLDVEKQQQQHHHQQYQHQQYQHQPQQQQQQLLHQQPHQQPHQLCQLQQVAALETEADTELEESSDALPALEKPAGAASGTVAPAAPHSGSAGIGISDVGSSRNKLLLSSSNSSNSLSSSASSSKVKRLKLAAALHHRKLLKRTVVLVFTWFALYIVSYGVNLGSGALPGSVYVTFSLLTAAEISAQLLTVLVADKAGRHNILSFGLVLAGVSCLACATTDGRTAKAVLAVFGKFGGTIGMAVLGTFTTELFATPIRASAMGIFNEAGRFGSIIAPLMLMLGAQVMPGNATFVPFMAFGVAALLAGLLTLLLPETLGAAMPESVEDMNQLMSVLSAQPWRQGPLATFKFVFRSKAVRAARQQQAACKQQQQPPQQKAVASTKHVAGKLGGASADVLLINVACGSGSGSSAPSNSQDTAGCEQCAVIIVDSSCGANSVGAGSGSSCTSNQEETRL